jgi:hypothetical protein
MMAAGMNELFTAPLLSDKRNSFDWDESINAITRHVIEEFSNLQHFVPYLYERCTLLGKAGLNWIPTYGTWLQHNKKTADSTSIGFYHSLEKLAAKQVDRSNTPFGQFVDAKLGIVNKTIAAGHAFLTTLNEDFSKKTFVPLSNKLTKLSYEVNKYNGPYPKPGVTIAEAKLDFPSLGSFPKLPQLELTLPKLPKLDSLPKLPSLGSLPKLPKLDPLPRWELPDVQFHFELDSLPKFPKVDLLPKLPKLPKLDSLPRLPKIFMPTGNH